MSTPSEPPTSSTTNQSEIQHQAYRALPRDPSQPEHKKPRAFIHRPNEEPAEGSAGAASVIEAAKTIQLEDFSKVHKTPCVRNALLPAIGGGVAVGAGRFVLGGSIMAACNWASGCFVGVSLVAYNWCQRRRQLEKEGIRKAVEVLDRKQAIKEMQEKAMAVGTMAGGKVAGTTSAATPAASTVATTGGQQGPGTGTNFWSTFKFW